MKTTILLLCIATLVCNAYAENTDLLVPVIVSKYDLKPYRKVITEHMVGRVKYPEHLLPRYAPLDIKDVLGKLPTEPIYKGEIVSLARLIDKDEYNNEMELLIPPGFAYTTLPFSLPETIGGLELEEERVDIVATYKDNNETVACIAAQKAIVGKIGPVVNNKYRPFFMIVDTEDANRIGILRTMPTIKWHILVRDRWLSTEERPLEIRQPQ